MSFTNATNYCSNMDCLCPLTPDEIQAHYEMHQTKTTQPIIHSIKITKENCQKKLSIAIDSLQRQLESVDLQYLMSPEEMVKKEMIKMDKYRKIMIDMINHFFEVQSNKFQNMIKFNSLKIRDAVSIFDEVKNVITQLEGLKNSLNGTNILNQLSKALRLDVKRMMDKYKSRINKTVNQKDIAPIKVNINEEKMYQLNTYLEKVVQVFQHQDQDEEQEQNIQPIQQFNDTVKQNHNLEGEYQLQQQQQHQQLQQIEPEQEQENIFAVNIPDYFHSDVFKFLHYFVGEDKLLYILDIQKLQEQCKFNVIQLQQSFNIPFFHRSISTPDGQIYLSGGSINDNDKNEFMYNFNQSKQCLNIIATMSVGRSSHGMIYCNQYIYLVSGFIKGKQLTTSFERMNCITNKVEKLQNCLQAANSPTLCNYQNKYLYKFGGNNSDGSLVQIIERFDIAKNDWEQIDAFLEESEIERFQMIHQYAAGIQISDNLIYIFGGYDAQNNGTDFSFLIYVDNKDDKINHIICSQFKPLPIKEAFWNNQVISYQNKFYVLQNIDFEGEIDEHSRRILCFNGNTWINFGEGE